MLPLAVTRSFAVGVATSYVLLLLWMTSWLHIMGRNRRHKKAVGPTESDSKGQNGINFAASIRTGLPEGSIGFVRSLISTTALRKS